jgi:hypothetical protein
MVRSMMSQIDLPLFFWGYAPETAVFILNRVPTKYVERTPYEICTRKCPKLSFLKVWGCEAYVKHLMSGKLTSKSDKYFFVGVSEGNLSHPVFKAKTRCSSYVCPGSSCYTYGQNVSTEYQCLYYIVSYYKNLLQVQKGLNNGMNPILPQTVDRGFHTPRRNLHQRTPHPLSSRT